MKTVFPKYYAKFKCRADKCSDNCCIGWEIDVDDVSYEKYCGVNGDFGQMLRDRIYLSPEGDRCFRLGDNDRCPFLNKDNLCDLILAQGEGALCQIWNGIKYTPRSFTNLRSLYRFT